MTEPAPRSIKASRAYRTRLSVTASSLGLSWGLTAFSPPLVAQGTQTALVMDLAACVVFAAGMALRLWAILTIAGRKKHEVVRDGPYQLCRNPLYVGTALLGLALVLFLKSITVGIGFLIPVALYTWGVVPAEESYLRERFGAAYDRYCAGVPRWLPRWSNLVGGATGTLGMGHKAVAAELFRLLGWLALPLAAGLTCHARAQDWWPIMLPFS